MKQTPGSMKRSSVVWKL